MRDFIIHFLGGYTAEEYEDLEEDYDNVFEEMANRGETIARLQDLVPAPKPKGRPKKVSTDPVKVV